MCRRSRACAAWVTPHAPLRCPPALSRHDCSGSLGEARRPDRGVVRREARLTPSGLGGMRGRVAGLIAAGWTLALAAAASAAPLPEKRVEPPKLTHPMQVVIVTDSRAGCEPNCAQWISAEGEIAADTPAQFRRIFRALGPRKLPIFISSSGGRVDAALAIGREIRKRRLDVAVERTSFQKCEATPSCDRLARKDGDRGRPEPIAAYCASSCVFILAAGVERVVPAYGLVGLHAIVQYETHRRLWRTYRVERRIENGQPVEVSRKLVSEKLLSSTTVQKEADYAAVRAYFTEMGIDTATIMPLVMATPHTSIRWTTPEERRTTRLVTRVGNGGGLVPIPRPDAATTDPAALQDSVDPDTVSADVMLVYPPDGDITHIYLRLKSPDPQLRTDQLSAELQFADGKQVTAGSTGGSPDDPLFATLANTRLCALRRAGDLSVKITLNDTADASPLKRFALDLAKSRSFADFAAKRCKD
jgi:hypothetical protein